jgi:UDP-N-acetyl-2-amino-2-deoxyglucuronate dehydrogenase
MGKYRAGIIGCGGIGRKRANAYAQMANVDLVAGADPSNRREAEYREIGIQHFYRDALEMLSKEELDLVSVCTNPAQPRIYDHGSSRSWCKRNHLREANG